MALQIDGQGSVVVALRGDDQLSPVVLKATETSTKAIDEMGKAAEKAVGDASASVNSSIDAVSTKAAGALATNSKAATEAGVAMVGTLGAIGVAAGLAATALGYMGLKGADDTRKMAEQIGMSQERFQQFAYAARMSDLSAGDLARSLLFMEKTLQKTADVGGKEMVKMLKDLGLQQKNLMGLGPEEAFLRLAEAISKVEDPMRRAQATMLLFGKGSADFLNFMSGGRKEIEATAAELEQFGGMTSTLTGQQANQFFDNLDRVGTALGGVQRQLANGLAAQFRGLSDALVYLFKDAGALKAMIVLLEALGKALLFVAQVVATAVVAISAVVGDIGRLAGGIGAALVLLSGGKVKEAGAALGQMFDDIKSKSLETEKALQQLWNLEGTQPGATPPAAKDAGKGFRKMGGADAGGGGFMQTAFGGDNPSGMWSDMLPDAETTGAAQLAAEDQLSQHVARSVEIERSGLEQRSANTMMYEQMQFGAATKYRSLNLDSAQFFFSQMGALMQTKSRAMFEIGKVGAIAEATIATYRAATGAYAALAGIPIIGPALGAAAAAAAVAVGFARVQAIRSTSFGGASGSPVLSAGGASGPVVQSGSAGTLAPPGATQGQAAGAGRVVNVNLQGNDIYSAASVRDSLIPALNEAIGDGVTLNVRTA